MARKEKTGGKHRKGKVQTIGKHRRENTRQETRTEAVEATARERDKDKDIREGESAG